jgi:hypothetical protein
VKVWRNLSGTDALFGFLEIMLMIFVLYYIFREFWEILSGGVKEYGSDPWNVMDFLNYVIFLVSFVFRIQYMTLISGLEVREDRYVDLQKVAFFIKQEDNLMAVNAFLTFFKMFQYLAFFPKLTLLFRTLSNAATDMFLFVLLFGVCFWGFQASFHLAFGSDIPEYRTLLQTAFSLTRLLMGDYDFEKMYEVNSFLAPVLFMSFTVLSAFILINMFLAILNDSLLIVKDQIACELEAAEALEMEKSIAVDNVLEDLLNNDKDDWVRVEELTELLVRKGLDADAAREKARSLLDQFDADHSGDLDEGELQAIRDHLDQVDQGRRNAIIPTEEAPPAAPRKRRGSIGDEEALRRMEEYQDGHPNHEGRRNAIIPDEAADESIALFGNIITETDLIPLEDHQAKALASLSDKLTKMVDRSDALAEYTHVGPTTNRTVNVYKNVRWKLGMLSRAISGDNPSEHWSDDEADK